MQYILGHCHKRWPKIPVEQRFWKFVAKTDNCWIWTGALCRGYGRFQHEGRAQLAHRFGFYLQTGKIPPPELLHDCDNPSCVRVSQNHVHAGIHAENMADAAIRGRTERGEKHHNAKLNNKDIEIIRAAHSAGVSQADLARKFQISRGHMSLIINRKLWPHL